jgi:hypothetical protein
MKIDRLSLHLSGLSPEEGQRLARLIAERLGTGVLSDVGAGVSAGPGAESRPDIAKRASIDSIKVQAAAQPRGDLDRLASQIAAQVLRELGRSL